MVIPNERRATRNGRIWGAALRDGPCLRPAAFCFADVQQAYCAQHALQEHKHGCVDTASIRVTKP